MTDVRTLLTGLAMGESPRWHDGRLWLSDWGAGEIVAVDLAGSQEVMLRDVGPLPFSIDWLPDGRLLVFAGRDGLLLRQEPDGSLVTHADLTALHAPPWNELVADGHGNVYVNATGFEFPGGEFAPGIVAMVRPDGSVRQVADGIAFPNGMAVTADGATLIVAESYAARLTAFDIDADGELAGRRVWAAVPDSAPDGICLDADGAVWYADVPNRRCVRVREGGEVLQVVELDRGGFACMLGGPDGRMLFVCANEWGGPEAAGQGRTGQVVTVEAPAPHAGRP